MRNPLWLRNLLGLYIFLMVSVAGFLFLAGPANERLQNLLGPGIFASSGVLGVVALLTHRRPPATGFARVLKILAMLVFGLQMLGLAGVSILLILACVSGTPYIPIYAFLLPALLAGLCTAILSGLSHLGYDPPTQQDCEFSARQRAAQDTGIDDRTEKGDWDEGKSKR